MANSHLESQFNDLWRYHYPKIKLTREYKFLPNRRFRFDFCHILTKTAIEIHGGRYVKGNRSHFGAGAASDHEKLNLAQMDGWLVFQLCDNMITDHWLKAIAVTIRQRMRSL